MFDYSITSYMTRRVITASASADVASIIQLLQSHRVSSVPIVGPEGAPIGLVSRTDLIRHGLAGLLARTGPNAASLAIPQGTARDIMSTTLVTLRSDRTLRDAAAEMVRHSVHRVLVTEADRLIGIVSTTDLAAAVHGARIDTPISDWMTSPAVTITSQQPVAAAIDLLNQKHLSAVIVVDDGWPVGILSQVDAIAARDVARDTPVDSLMDSAIVCLPSTMRVFRAAGHAAQLDVRRVVVTLAHEVVGIISGLDFARIILAS